MAGAAQFDGGGRGRRSETLLRRTGAGRSSHEDAVEMSGGFGAEGDDVLGRAFTDELAAFRAGFGAEVEDPVGAFHHVEVVLDDEERVAGVDERLEHAEEPLDVGEMEAGGWLVEDEEFRFRIADCGLRIGRGFREELAELDALGFAAGEGVEWLAEFQVTQTHFGERREQLHDLAVALLELGGDAIRRVEGDGFIDGELEDVGDRFSEVVDVEGGGLEASATAVRTGDVEVGQELHFDLLEARTGAAIAAAVAGVEREEAGVHIAGLGVFGAGEELSDRIEGSEEHGGSGARGAGDRRLVNQLDASQIRGSQ